MEILKKGTILYAVGSYGVKGADVEVERAFVRTVSEKRVMIGGDADGNNGTPLAFGCSRQLSREKAEACGRSEGEAVGLAIAARLGQLAALEARAEAIKDEVATLEAWRKENGGET